MAIGDRIKARRLEVSMTIDELAEKLGKNRATVYRYESNDIENFPTTVLEPLAKALKTTPAYLMGWENDNTNDLNRNVFSIANIHPVELRKIPMLGEIACGKPIFADEDKEHYVMADCDIKADFCLTAKGDSMINAGIHEDDIVFIHSQPTVDDGEIAVVLIDDEATLKRVYCDKHSITLVAENPKYRPMTYTENGFEVIRILGKAIAIQRAL